MGSWVRTPAGSQGSGSCLFYSVSSNPQPCIPAASLKRPTGPFLTLAPVRTPAGSQAAKRLPFLYKKDATKGVCEIISPRQIHLESTGICLLIDSSREISVSVLMTPGIAWIFSVSTSRRCSLSRV